MFYATKTCGTNYKIPILHHKFQEKEWTAVARILAFGWQKFQFFPVQLAPPFLTEALSLSCSDNLLEDFFNYISASEKDMLTEAISNFKGADMDELISILSSHNCCVLPTEENLPSLVEEIAHKEMVQEPAFIIKCWRPILRSIGQSMSWEGLKKILDDLKPKPRNIIKTIKFPGSMSLEEQTTSNHLLRFVRERDEKELGLFLRYCTGSDLSYLRPLKSLSQQKSHSSQGRLWLTPVVVLWNWHRTTKTMQILEQNCLCVEEWSVDNGFGLKRLCLLRQQMKTAHTHTHIQKFSSVIFYIIHKFSMWGADASL